eukprot:jgi/Orpsp1_1/1183314/evm.model.c7180000084667.3
MVINFEQNSTNNSQVLVELSEEKIERSILEEEIKNFRTIELKTSDDETYEVFIKLIEKLDKKQIEKKFILITAKEKDKIIDFVFEKWIDDEILNSLKRESVLIGHCNNMDDFFNFLLDSIEENIISIKKRGSSDLIIKIAYKMIGFKNPVSLKIKLKMKNCNIGDTMKIACQKINKLENENELAKEKINKLENENEELMKELEKANEKLGRFEKIVEVFQFSVNHKIFENEKEVEFIKNRLLQIPGYETKKVTLKLIYRLSNNGPSISDFHKICDNIPNNLTLVKTIKGERFGGFTQQPWTSSNTDKKDDNAFCFSLSKKKIYNIIKGLDAIGDYNTYGPIFRKDIFYISKETLNIGYCENNNRNYSGEEKLYEINGGENKFTVHEFEFYQVLFE